MTRVDFQSSENGVAYLALLDGVIAEPDFKATCQSYLADFKGDPGRAADAALALKGGQAAEAATLKVAECILQERLHPKVHTR